MSCRNADAQEQQFNTRLEVMVSLNGTLETFPLPDVLALLAATKKTGELQVDGGRGSARVWLDQGQMVGTDVPRATTFVDAVFEMLRLTTGRFSFENDSPAPEPLEPVALEPLLLEAQSRLGEWRSIEAVVPSLDCGVRLAPEVTGPKVTVTPDQWRALVAAATGGDVNGVMTALGLGEFDGCRVLRDLVQTGLVSIEEPPARRPAPRPTSRPEPVQEMAPPLRQAQDKTEEPATAPEPEVAAPAPARRPAAGVPSKLTAPAAKLRPSAPPKPGGGRPASPVQASPGQASPVQAPTRTFHPDAGTVLPEAQPAPPKSPAPTADADELVHQLSEIQSEPRRRGARRQPDAPATDAVPAEPGEVEGQGPQANGAADEGAEDHAEKPRHAGDDGPAKGDEPINRGLLLKFLNSVRS